MYEPTLFIHNITRWLVLLAAIYLIYRSIRGFTSRTYTPADRQAGQIYAGLMILQLVSGFLLMIYSPLVQSSLANLSAAMEHHQTRFFVAEHWVVMVLATILAHVGLVRVKKITDAIAKQRQALIWYGLSLALVLLGIPWWRPLI